MNLYFSIIPLADFADRADLIWKSVKSKKSARIKFLLKQLINPESNRNTKRIQNDIINIENAQSCEILKAFHNDNREKKVQNQYPKIVELRKDNSKKSKRNKHQNIAENINDNRLPKNGFIYKTRS